LILQPDKLNIPTVSTRWFQFPANLLQTIACPFPSTPNPTTGRLTFNVPEDAAGEWLLRVQALDGRLLSETPLLTNGGSTETTLPENLPAGLYLIELQNESRFYRARVVLE